MNAKIRFLSVISTATMLLIGGLGQSMAAKVPKPQKQVAPADRQAAAKKTATGGLTLQALMATDVAALQMMPNQTPRYFSHPNYANSQLPEPDVDVTIGGDGSGATAKAIMVGPNGEILAIVVDNPGSGYTTPTVTITPTSTSAPTTPAVATAVLDAGKVVAITVDNPGSGYAVKPGTGLRKFVDTLPNLPIAKPDKDTYPGSDYYEIELVEYTQQMHTDLPIATKLRGYRQIGSSLPPQYLGPAIVAAKDRPVRILFKNNLPTGLGGNLFLPVDTSVMGAGMGPGFPDTREPDPLNPTCGNVPPALKDPKCYSENRANLHLHGGLSPWISDGTPHQWITPAGEATDYAKGVSVGYVPDMWFDASGKTIPSCAGQTTCAVTGATNNPGSGAQTYYYTNQQSARLMFYHDHAWGITRLNVYAGEAAPYIITDATEDELVSKGIIPGTADTIPLVLQDKTFVPSNFQLAVSDETWDTNRWGQEGDLWLPHVYSPAQNPGDSSGVNQFGRWAYGPWFWPPTSNIEYPPVANTYFDPTCISSDTQWCEPEQMPGTPFNSMGMEAFHDTPVVNGVAYPTMTVEPKPYRLRILNAANDRFFNLSLYVADTTGKEVALNAAEVAAALTDPAGVFPTPDETISKKGPNWIQIGTEGGFLPAPVIIPPQPITWVTDPTVFNAGNVDKHSLLLGPAERADVIVDFSTVAPGTTLILYNDAPAAFPARDPRYDYYTGNADLRDTGGAPSTLPGYGPNTRTVMQIVVAGTPGTPFDQKALDTAFKATSLGGGGVFEKGQHPIIVGQGAYNSAYGTSFPVNSAKNKGDGLVRIDQFDLTFKTLSGVDMKGFPLQPKAIQDEQGEAFDPEYGRMSGNLGLEVPLTQAGTQQNLILYPFVNPTSELIDTTKLPKANVKVEPFSVANDGTQLWRITHNGVDTHPIHFHLFDVQVLNRVGWDGIIRKPDANELGWKDTVRISPLEDTIVALRPIIPVVPFKLPNSIRPLNPARPTDSMMGFKNVDANAAPTTPIINKETNFGWEYVWHCHILSHEEMDMMRPISAAAPPESPTNLTATVAGNGNNRTINLLWKDNSLNETNYIIQRATNNTFTTGLTTLATRGANTTSYSDLIGNTNQTYFYRVFATNLVGYAATPGYATMSANSDFSNVASSAPIVTLPAAPSNVVATAVRQGNNARVTLTWTDNANNETGFTIQRATDASFTANVVTSTVGANTTTFTTGNVARTTAFYFRVLSSNSAGQSVWVNATPSPITTP